MNDENFPNNNTENKIFKKYYFIKKSILSKKEYEECQNDLHVVSKIDNYITGKPSSEFDVFVENEEWIGVPIGYGISRFGKADISHEHDGTPINLKFIIEKYRTDYPQEDVITGTVSNLNEKGCIQVCLDTGLGKTICSLDIISRMGRKTLIVVHKKDSIEQWKKKIEKHLPDATCGEMRGSKISRKNIDGKDIVFSTVQSLSQIHYDESILSQFGFLIADEIHLMAAETFHKAFINVHCKYRLGLSATPTRKDGLSKVISWFFGDISFNIKQPRTDINVIVLHYREGFDEGRSKVRWIGHSKQNRVAMVTDLVNDDERNNMIIQQARKMSSKESQTLILSERVAHTKNLNNCIDLVTNEKFYIYLRLLQNNKITIQPEFIELLKKKFKFITTGILIGNSSQDEREKNKLADVICATTKMAKDSLDLTNLSNMIVATPISKNDIQQVRGRLLRKTCEEDPKIPKLCLIFDEWDGVEYMFKGMFWGVLSFLKSEKYKIKHK